MTCFWVLWLLYNGLVMTYLTVPISAEDLEQARFQIKAAKAAGAEMLELRTDYLAGLGTEMVKELIAEVKQGRRALPVIVTCRDKLQGGNRDYPIELRTGILIEALKAGAEFIDFEYENFLRTESQEKIRVALSRSLKGRLILSAHNFKGKFSDIKKLHRHILTLHPAAIPKLVYKAEHINDCFDGFDLLRQTSGERIIFCMGQAGHASRIIAKKLGGFVSFAGLDEESATAPGQLTIKQMKKEYRWDSINADTELYGVAGSPVGHSLSPAVHNACFGDIEANKLYLHLPVDGGREEFDAFFHKISVRSWLGFRGFSVTIPHKQNALNFVRQQNGYIEPLAEKIGAANTVVLTPDGQFRAYNTDYAGALDAITSTLEIERDDLEQMSVAVIGAGGVARAIVAGLRDAGASVKIYNRTIKKAADLANEFGCEFAPLNELPDIDASLVINCTSVGMHPDVEASPLPEECLKKSMAVFDTVYNPAKTLLLTQAKKKRVKTIDGISMFVNQAMAQFKLFTGKDANPKLMRRVVNKNLSQQ